MKIILRMILQPLLTKEHLSKNGKISLLQIVCAMILSLPIKYMTQCRHRRTMF